MAHASPSTPAAGSLFAGGLTGMETANCRVVCRFRPTVPKDKSAKPPSSTYKYSFNILSPIQIEIAKEQIGQKTSDNFHFDKIYDGAATQEQVYEHIAKETVEDVLNGYNGTVMCYGQTGAGKTYTMFGPELEKDALKGIIPRAIRDRETEFAIKCSFLEIYKERIRDLLNPKNANLKVRETPSRGVWVDGITEEIVSTESEVMELLKFGAQFRQIGATSSNDSSTRAHSLFMLTLTQKFPDGSAKTGKLNLADLAGSENIFRSGATGAQVEEAKKINQSLSALGNCIKALSERLPHVPYRDSKLTHILRDSLGGNAKTTLVLCCSPHPFDGEQTLSTLRFGQKAKSLRNIVTVNRQRSNYELLQIIEMLKKELLAMKKYAEYLEEELRKLKGPNWKPSMPRPNFMSVSITSMENKVLNEGAAASGGGGGVGGGAKGAQATTDGGGYQPYYEGEVEEEPTDDENGGDVIDALDIAQLKVELETAREEGQMRIDELTRELKEAAEQAEEDREKMKKLAEELAAKQRELDQMRREAEDKEDALKSQVSELRYEAQKAALDAEAEAAKATMLALTNSDLLKAMEEAKASLSLLHESHRQQEENERRRRAQELAELERAFAAAAAERERQIRQELTDKAARDSADEQRRQAMVAEQTAAAAAAATATTSQDRLTSATSTTKETGSEGAAGGTCPHCGRSRPGDDGGGRDVSSKDADAERVRPDQGKPSKSTDDGSGGDESKPAMGDQPRSRRRSEVVLGGDRRSSLGQAALSDAGAGSAGAGAGAGEASSGARASQRLGGSVMNLLPRLTSSGDLDSYAASSPSALPGLADSADVIKLAARAASKSDGDDDVSKRPAGENVAEEMVVKTGNDKNAVTRTRDDETRKSRTDSGTRIYDPLLSLEFPEERWPTALTSTSQLLAQLRTSGNVEASEGVGCRSAKEIEREASMAVAQEFSIGVLETLDQLRRQVSQSQALNDIDAKKLRNVESRIQEMQEALLKEKEAKNRVQDAFDEARVQWQAREEELKRQLSLYEQGVRREIERETLKSTKVVKKQRQRLRDALWSKKAYSRKEAQHRDPPTKEGWLTKQGGLVKSWKRRYFFLQKGSMYYFDDPSKDKALGFFDLRGCAVMDAEEETKKPFSFGIFHKSQRTYWLHAKDRQEMTEWMDTLQQAIDMLDEEAQHHDPPAK
ncbi:kinesin motor domain containing protein [Acanthamoeba castellanii str. Neff]|uniref:Kinesin motor domain containing protein n=1 Tax=Acanthamoeba castellanii (strain ATCC 30010 / Neff) TaxID=1257118 RepID=L8GCU9_ACACF|nr:kinesin motor domain containing protein [Acanthamoeba castellanii str. Neff]ELR10902.1 kinesin motor domain containing protein [Acanthamoeba castellanii str. Neff]